MSRSIVELPNGTAIYVETQGPQDATPIVFIHGLGATHSLWQPLLECSDITAKFFVVLYDYRGAGLSPLSSTKADDLQSKLSLQTHIDDLNDLFDKLFTRPRTTSTVQKPILVGHSMGSILAQIFAVQFPELISRLILVNTSLVPFPPEVRETQYAWARNVRDNGSVLDIANQLADILVAKPTANPVARAMTRALVLAQNVEGYAGNIEALAGWTETVDLKEKFKGPIRIIGGDADAFGDGSNLLDSLRGADVQHHNIPGVGHSSPVENPEALAKVLLTCL
jgi:pimeloyl-ACP methyl ester carboxylesterase